MRLLTEVELILSDDKAIRKRLPRFPSGELSDSSLDLFTVINSVFLAEEVITSNKSPVTELSIPLNNSYSNIVNSTIEDLIVFLISSIFGSKIHRGEAISSTCT